MKTILPIIACLTLLCSCDRLSNKPPEEAKAPQTLTIKRDTSANANRLEEVLKTIPPGIRPVAGYRFVIKGDFDGDGKQETLTEHYISLIDRQETNKGYDGLPEYDQLVALTIKKQPYAFVMASKPAIDTLRISSDPQLLGLSYLKNEGDLDGDGADELSYVVDWADYSSGNTWHIMSYKNRHWKELYSFAIWDWQLPDLPQAMSEYELSGQEGKNAVPESDTLNVLLQEQLDAFPGLVKKMGGGKIMVIYKNEQAAQDTMVVDLKHLK